MRTSELKTMPTMRVAMTPFPHWVDADASLAEALRLMAEHEVHHLPVKNGDELFSVLTEREVNEALAQGRVADHAPVRDACRDDVYVVDTLAPLDGVLRHMAERHLGSAVVAKEGRLAGIYTVTDACADFADLLTSMFPSAGPGDDAA